MFIDLNVIILLKKELFQLSKGKWFRNEMQNLNLKCFLDSLQNAPFALFITLTPTVN